MQLIGPFLSVHHFSFLVDAGEKWDKVSFINNK